MTAQSPERPADEVRLEELAGKATPGPWQHDRSSVYVLNDWGANRFVATVQGGFVDRNTRTSSMELDDNALFIAACHPQAILTLLSRLTALRAERDAANARAGEAVQRLRELIEAIDGGGAKLESHWIYDEGNPKQPETDAEIARWLWHDEWLHHARRTLAASVEPKP